MSETKLVVITGGPGVGKTTLLNELARLGFCCIPEVARDIIKEQVASRGIALPWEDRDAFTALMLSRTIETESRIRAQTEQNGIVFLDRGIPDILSYSRLIGRPPQKRLMEAVREFSYFRTVFLPPPWPEIYANDEQRKQDFAEAIRTDEWIRKTYAECGYEVVEVPRVSPKERAAFVLRRLRVSPD